jgi:hypothetical protein
LTTEAFYALPLDEQNIQIAKWHRDQYKCPECGRTGGECADPDRDWFPQRSICYATLELISANAQYERLHKQLPYHDGTFKSWAAEPSRSHPYRFTDGVTIWVAPVDLDPEDDFLGAAGSAALSGNSDEPSGEDADADD